MIKTWLKEKSIKAFLYDNTILGLIPFGETASKNNITMLSTHLTLTSRIRRKC